MEAALEALEGVGNVVVTRTASTDGFTWTVTFASCRGDEDSGDDVCNIGNVEQITFATSGSLAGCSGSGPGTTSAVVVEGAAGNVVEVVDLADGPPFRYCEANAAHQLDDQIWNKSTAAETDQVSTSTIDPHDQSLLDQNTGTTSLAWKRARLSTRGLPHTR